MKCCSCLQRGSRRFSLPPMNLLTGELTKAWPWADASIYAAAQVEEVAPAQEAAVPANPVTAASSAWSSVLAPQEDKPSSNMTVSAAYGGATPFSSLMVPDATKKASDGGREAADGAESADAQPSVGAFVFSASSQPGRQLTESGIGLSPSSQPAASTAGTQTAGLTFGASLPAPASSASQLTSTLGVLPAAEKETAKPLAFKLSSAAAPFAPMIGPGFGGGSSLAGMPPSAAAPAEATKAAEETDGKQAEGNVGDGLSLIQSKVRSPDRFLSDLSQTHFAPR
jgi:hypothetical protein